MLRWRDVSALILVEEAPCISIYVPTTPVSNYREENRIAYKDQIQKVSAQLNERDMDKFLREDLIEKLQTVGSTELFWTHQQYGLAIFLSSERFWVRRMMGGLEKAQGIVANTFHLRPALRETANWMRYQVLCVSLHEVALYDCNREHTAEVELHGDVPSDMGDAIGQTETSPNTSGSERSADDSTQLKRYFHTVDQAIRSYHNGRTRLPLVLATVAEYQGLFREVSENPNLLDMGLESKPFEEIRQNRLGEASWAIAEQALHRESDRWVERYNERAAHNEGENDVEQVAYAATIGQIETVLIDEDARIEGTINPDTGTVMYGAAADAQTDDVVDTIAEYVLRFDGEVRFIPNAHMPTDTGVAAVLRFAMYPEA